MNYYPRNLTLTKPVGESIFEFLVEGRHDVQAFCHVLKVFSDHRVDVQSTSSDVRQIGKEKQFLMIAFSDFSGADCAVEHLEKELKALPFVQNVLSADMEGRLFDQFIFPTRIMGSTRVIVFRVEPLLNIERSLVKHFGSAGAAIMYEEGKSYADRVVDQYISALPDISIEDMLENIKDGLRATGWGVFDFKKVQDGFEVIVRDSPLDEASDYKESRFYYGVVAKVLEKLYGVELSVKSSDVSLEGKELSFKLAAK